MVLQSLVNGLTLGSVYALIALGYTMVYGILELINFAHGEIYMVGAYIGYGVLIMMMGMNLHIFGYGFTLAMVFVITMILVGFLGVAIERFAYRPLRDSPRLAPLICAVGVSIFLQNIVMLICGTGTVVYPEILPNANFAIGDVNLNFIQLFIMGVSFGTMIVLHLFIKNTKLGKAMRAVAQDRTTASLMGINVDVIISVTFFIGSALGAVAGILVGMRFDVEYNMGYLAGLKAFTAAVLGGIGNVPGAMLGGLVLGIAENFASIYLLPYIGLTHEYKDALAFVILIIVLIVKPSGILGERIPEKV